MTLYYIIALDWTDKNIFILHHTILYLSLVVSPSWSNNLTSESKIVCDTGLSWMIEGQCHIYYFHQNTNPIHCCECSWIPHPWIAANLLKNCNDHVLTWFFNFLWPSDTIWQHKYESILAQVMACMTAPSHYLNQCSLLISETLWLSPETRFLSSAQATVLFNEFEKYMLSITTILPRGQWIDSIESWIVVAVVKSGSHVVIECHKWLAQGVYKSKLLIWDRGYPAKMALSAMCKPFWQDTVEI